MKSLWLMAAFYASTACGQATCPSVNSRFTVCQDTAAGMSWMVLFQQTNRADAGENVVLYAQQLKQGVGNSWGSVVETRCLNPRNGCHGQEVDLVVGGPALWGDWRIGYSVVLSKLPGSEGVPTANFGILVAPQWEERENIRADVGIGIQTRNNIGALQIRSGERIILDDAGRIGLRFNPATQRIEFLNGDRVLQSIPVD